MNLNRSSLGPTLVACCSIGLMSATLLYIWFVPQPGGVNAAREFRRERDGVHQRMVAASADRNRLEADIRGLTWQLDPPDAGPAVLASITEAARKSGVRIASFRPSKPDTVEGLVRIPFEVMVEGSFPAVSSFARNIEAPFSKLAVRS